MCVRHASWLLLIVPATFVSSVPGQEIVITKKAGLSIYNVDPKDPKSTPREVARLSSAYYTTLPGRTPVAAFPDWYPVREKGKEGWLDKNEAVKFQDALAEFPAASTDSLIRGRRALAYELRGDLNEAIKEYDSAISLKAEAAWFNGRGCCWFKRAHKERTTDAPNWNYVTAWMAKARADFKAAKDLDPNSTAAHNNLGMCFEVDCKFAEAKRIYEATIKADPNDPTGYNALAWLLATCPAKEFQDGNKAVEYAQQASKLTGGMDDNIQDTLAAALARDGQFEPAQKTLTEFLLKVPDLDPKRKQELEARVDLYKQRKALDMECHPMPIQWGHWLALAGLVLVIILVVAFFYAEWVRTVLARQNTRTTGGPGDAVEFPDVLQHELAVIQDKRKVERLDVLHEIGSTKDYAEQYVQILLEAAGEEERRAHRADRVVHQAERLYGYVERAYKKKAEPPFQLKRLCEIFLEIGKMEYPRIPRYTGRGSEANLNRAAQEMEESLRSFPSEDESAIRIAAYRSVRTYLCSLMPVHMLPGKTRITREEPATNAHEVASREIGTSCLRARILGQKAIAVLWFNRAAQAAEQVEDAVSVWQKAEQKDPTKIGNVPEKDVVTFVRGYLEAAILAARYAIQAIGENLAVVTADTPWKVEARLREPREEANLAQQACDVVLQSAAISSSASFVYPRNQTLRADRHAHAVDIARTLELVLKILELLHGPLVSDAAPDANAGLTFPEKADSALLPMKAALGSAVRSLAGALSSTVVDVSRRADSAKPFTSWLELRTLSLSWHTREKDESDLLGAVEAFCWEVENGASDSGNVGSELVHEVNVLQNVAGATPPPPPPSSLSPALAFQKETAANLRLDFDKAAKQFLRELVHEIEGCLKDRAVDANLTRAAQLEAILRRWSQPKLPVEWNVDDTSDIIAIGLKQMALKVHHAATWAWTEETRAETYLRKCIDELDGKLRELIDVKQKAKLMSTSAEDDGSSPSVSVAPVEAARAQARKMKLVGLAFSGGGIRSATFNLGILQGLAQMRLLNCFDYLSTVSGGGFIGGWLAAWVSREQSLVNVERQLCPARADEARASRKIRENDQIPGSDSHPIENDRPLDEEPEPVFHLRAFSRYLAPRTGLFSLDTWTLAALFIRNLLFNQLLFLPMAILVVLLPRVLVWLFTRSGGGELGYMNGIATLLLLTGGGCFLLWMNSQRSWVRQAVKNPRMPPSTRRPSQKRAHVFGLLVLGMSVIFVWLLTFDPTRLVNGEHPLRHPAYEFLASFEGSLYSWAKYMFNFGFFLSVMSFVIRCVKGHTSDWLVFASDIVLGLSCGLFVYLAISLVVEPLGTNVLPIVTLGAPAVLAALALAIFVEMALLSTWFSEFEREWQTRMAAFLLVLALVWLVLFAAIFYLPNFMFDSRQGPDWTLCSAWALISAAGAWIGKVLGKFEKMGSWTVPALRLLAHVAPLVFLIGLLALVSALVGFLFTVPEAWLVLDILQSGQMPDGADYFCKLLVMSACAGILCLAFNLLFDVNRFSLHAVYANRLTRCYLGASRRKVKWHNRSRGPYWDSKNRWVWEWGPGPGGAPTGADLQASARNANLFSGFDPGDDLPLADLKGVAADPDGSPVSHDEGYRGPYPLVNATLNLVAGSELAHQDRKAAPFVLTPDYCGSMNTRYVPTPADATSKNNMSLGSAMTVSGAAVDPNMAYWQNPGLTALMTIMNTRLGMWLENPRPESRDSDGAWKAQGKGPGFMIFNEFLGLTRDDSSYIHLSDGGHFENLGVYELIRRRCRFIVVSDAATDRTPPTDNLATLIRLVRIDLGIRIEIDLSQMTPGPANQNAWHCAIGIIRYDDVDKEAVAGTLVYMFASLTGDEPPDVRKYAENNPSFPHQSTADQFFTDEQFESYRALGHHVAMEVFKGSPAEGLPENALPLSVGRKEIGNLFRRLRRKWFPPLPGSDSSFPSAVRLGIDEARESRKDTALMNLRIRMHDADNTEIQSVNEMLRTMYLTWHGMKLNDYFAHPMNQGWMNSFRRATTLPSFHEHWPVLRAEYSTEFVLFCEQVLNLAPAVAEPVRPNDANNLAEWLRHAGAMDREFLREWASEAGTLPWLTTGSYITDRVRAACLQGARCRPLVWLINLTDLTRSAPHTPCGIVCSGPPYRGKTEEHELFVWLRGPFRTLGLGRQVLEPILAELIAESQQALIPRLKRLIAYYPDTGGLLANNLEKATWMNFFFDHSFHTTRRADPGSLAGVITLARDIK